MVIESMRYYKKEIVGPALVPGSRALPRRWTRPVLVNHNPYGNDMAILLALRQNTIEVG